MFKITRKVKAGLAALALGALLTTGAVVQGIGGIAKPPVEAVIQHINSGATTAQVQALAAANGFELAVR